MAGNLGHAADHVHLHVPGDTPIHRLPASAKLIGLVLFTVAVALTPRRAVLAFAVDAAVLGAVIVLARLHLRLIVGRLLVITPFVVGALLIPFISQGGDSFDLAGLTLSVDGSWAAWNIIAKATLGASASIVVSATTSVPELLAGFSTLRIPPVLVAIVTFMFRYLDLLIDQVRRMRNAMVARCHDARWLWQVRPMASSAGALFVRSYERGERVHHAMVARGYTGTMPTLTEQRSSQWHGVLAAIPGIVAATAAILVIV